MHPSVLAQDEISAQEGLELLKAYTAIRDPGLRAKILTWVMDAQAVASPSVGAPDWASTGETGTDRVG